MDADTSIFGCYVSNYLGEMNDPQEKKNEAQEQGKIFRNYIWSEKGIDSSIKTLNRFCYGNDLELILFQFYLNPVSLQIKELEDIAIYKKRERSIKIAIIINNANFFSRDEKQRQDFIRSAMIRKMDLLEDIVIKKKLDTKIDQLRNDLMKVLIAKTI